LTGAHKTKNPTHGQKVHSTKPGDEKHEASGTVISDSLAAESLRSGGDFSANNPTGISGTNANSSTLAQGADTIGVRVLAPTTAAAADDAREAEQTFAEDTGNVGSKGFKTTGSSVGVTAGKGAQEAKRKTDGSTDSRKGEFDTEDGPQEVKDLGEIGSEQDPGRLAEAEMVKKSATIGGVRSAGENTGDNENPYEALDAERDI